MCKKKPEPRSAVKPSTSSSQVRSMEPPTAQALEFKPSATAFDSTLRAVDTTAIIQGRPTRDTSRRSSGTSPRLLGFARAGADQDQSRVEEDR
jgi:hypothetical protein